MAGVFNFQSREAESEWHSGLAEMLSRWGMLSVGLLVQSIGGIMYAYALYSGLLKQQFSLTQEQTDLISTITLVGCNFGVHIGALYGKMGRRGPLVVILAGLIFGAAGWLPLWAIFHFHIHVAFPVILVMAFCQGHAQMAVDIATISTLVQNFPEHRGLVISLLKSYVGLSGALVGQVFAVVFKPMDDSCGQILGGNGTAAPTAAPTPNSTDFYADPYVEGVLDLEYGAGFGGITNGDAVWAAVGGSGSGEDPASYCQGTIAFLLFLGAEVVVVCLIGASCIRIKPPHAAETADSYDGVASRLRVVLYGTVFLALATAASSFAEYTFAELGHATYGLLAAVLLTFLGVMVLAGTRSDPADPDADRFSSVTARLLAKSVNTFSDDDDDNPDAPKNYTLGEAVTTPWLWVIFFSFMLGGGSGLVLNANLAQIIPTTEHHPSFDGSNSTVKKSIFVTLFSVCNCCGRLFAGLLGDWLLKSRRIPRPAVFALGLAMMSGAMVLLMVGSYTLLFPAVVLCGLAYGSFNALCPTLISELFGVKHFAKIYAFNSISLATGSYGMATVMAGRLYAQHPQEDKACTAGVQCYRTTFLICAVACAAMSAIMLGLARVTRKRYRQIYPNFFASRIRSAYTTSFD